MFIIYSNDELSAPVLRFLEDGKEVTKIDGVEYAVTVSGADVKLGILGVYTVRYSFTITNPRYNQLASVTLTVEVTEINYTYDFEAPTADKLTQSYTGKALDLPEATISNVKKLDGTAVTDGIKIEYKVNGEIYESGTLINVGAYHVEVTVYVNGEEVNTDEYTFTIEAADNTVTVKIGNIKEGGELKPEAEATFGADRVIYQYNTTNGTAGWGVRVPDSVGVYYVCLLYTYPSPRDS